MNQKHCNSLFFFSSSSFSFCVEGGVFLLRLLPCLWFWMPRREALIWGCTGRTRLLQWIASWWRPCCKNPARYKDHHRCQHYLPHLREHLHPSQCVPPPSVPHLRIHRSEKDLYFQSNLLRLQTHLHMAYLATSVSDEKLAFTHGLLSLGLYLWDRC